MHFLSLLDADDLLQPPPLFEQVLLGLDLLFLQQDDPILYAFVLLLDLFALLAI